MIYGISSSSFQYEEECNNSHIYNEKKKEIFHKKNWKKDFQLLKELGIQEYRFSLEWSSIEPKEGEYNKKEIKRYHTYIHWLKKNNIEPILCLFHFSMPKWFYKEGGFLKVPEKFQTFCKNMIQEYKVKYYIIYNEPNVYVMCSYMLARWKPHKKNYFQYSKCIDNMIKVYNSILTSFPRKKLGMILNIIPSIGSDTFLNDIFDSMWNTSFLIGISKKTSFIGINYYFSKDKIWSDVLFSGKKDFFKGKNTLSDLGWPVTPEGIHNAVSIIQSYLPKVDIWITENGVSTSNENKKIEFMRLHINECKKNPLLKKYFLWTLIDCFEWDYPNTKFGLVTKDRKKKKSFFEYKKIINE